MSAHPLYILAFATFLLLIGFLVWNLLSVKRRQKTHGHTTGIGGPNDPLA